MADGSRRASSLDHRLNRWPLQRQLKRYHPEMKDNFEVGAVQAWYSDPTSQGAFAI